jgi:hypothetical protein
MEDRQFPLLGLAGVRSLIRVVLELGPSYLGSDAGGVTIGDRVAEGRTEALLRHQGPGISQS